MTIEVWNYWEQNWNNAKNFFNSKGNIQTKSKLKKKWYKDFEAMIKDVEKIVEYRKKQSKE